VIEESMEFAASGWRDRQTDR